MKKKITKQHIVDIHINTAVMSLAALLTAFHLQLELPHKKHELELKQQANVVVDPGEISSLFEREREVHHNQGSYARARTVDVAGT